MTLIEIGPRRWNWKVFEAQEAELSLVRGSPLTQPGREVVIEFNELISPAVFEA